MLLWQQGLQLFILAAMHCCLLLFAEKLMACTCSMLSYDLCSGMVTAAACVHPESVHTFCNLCVLSESAVAEAKLAAATAQWSKLPATEAEGWGIQPLREPWEGMPGCQHACLPYSPVIRVRGAAAQTLISTCPQSAQKRQWHLLFHDYKGLLRLSCRWASRW